MHRSFTFRNRTENVCFQANKAAQTPITTGRSAGIDGTVLPAFLSKL